MSNLSGAVFDFEHIAEMINYVSDLSNETYEIELTKAARENIVENVLSHYHDHITAYDVTVSGSDPYKFLAWAGVFIYEELLKTDKEVAIKFLGSSVVALNRMIKETKGEFLPDWYIRKAIKMVLNEYNGKVKLGLGRNGLYMAFKGASL
ncbi:hypothetical protein [Aliarcobacter butzleri]|uniref:hypothetical protein n=1 Tax=Aliarcobacter butzleri TaxID=28197 RepID=UPI0021B3CF23|nr:hypothetical protein [Aliarcobacter butzleri]MCT7553817.1 hypothetical protein [Aliarcobacter butzleri]